MQKEATMSIKQKLSIFSMVCMIQFNRQSILKLNRRPRFDPCPGLFSPCKYFIILSQTEYSELNMVEENSFYQFAKEENNFHYFSHYYIQYSQKIINFFIIFNYFLFHFNSKNTVSRNEKYFILNFFTVVINRLTVRILYV